MAIFEPIPLPRQTTFLDAFRQAAMTPRMMQEADLKNQNMAITNKYAPQMNEAEIGLKNAQAFENQGRGTNYFGEATSWGHKNALTDAEARYKNFLPGYMNKELGIKQQQADQMGQRFGTVYQYTKLLSTMPAPARAAYLSQNPEAAIELTNALGNQGLQQLMTSPAIGPDNQNALNAQPQGQMGQPAPMNALSAQPQGQPIPAQGGQPQNAILNQGQPQFATSPDLNAEFVKSNQMYANKQLTTNKTRQRAEAGVALETLINTPEVDSAFQTLSKYSGMMGGAKAQLMRATNPEEWATIQNAKEQVIPVLSGSISTLEGFPTSDKGMMQALSYFKQGQQALLNNDPAFMKYINMGKDVLRKESESLQKAANPIYGVDNLPAKNNSEKSTTKYSSEDIAFTAKKYGIPESEVKKKLGMN